MIQKLVKNRTKNSLKKSAFTALHMIYFESCFRKFEVIAFFLPSCQQTAKKLFIFREKAAVCPTVYRTQ